jgi:1-deoxy-D-xylulose-5-phosphate synthase
VAALRIPSAVPTAPDEAAVPADAAVLAPSAVPAAAPARAVDQRGDQRRDQRPGLESPFPEAVDPLARPTDPIGDGPDGSDDLGVLGGLSPGAVRGLDRAGLDRLAAELRRFLVETVAETGGHLGSNLGAVELTIALHRVFDSPTDRLVWDTGHQAYVHKVLTGRAGDFAHLRRAGGLSGYPNRTESAHDIVENSHASTALSYADGLARADALTSRLAGDLDGASVDADTGAPGALTGVLTGVPSAVMAERPPGRRRVVAVIGDGALTGGLAYEALSNIGTAGTAVVIILNDNGRSYSPTVSRLTTAAGEGTGRLGGAGGGSAGGIGEAGGEVPHGAPDQADRTPGSFFGALGLRYCGPVDGHDVDAVEDALRWAARCAGPVVVHVHTVKGQGYLPAETDAEKCLHDVGPFDVATGRPKLELPPPTYTEAFGTALVAEAGRRPNVVAVTAAMAGPTGLLPFARRFPDRFVDVGIAEQHAVAAAAGMAIGGLRPVVAIYSTFLNRAWDQLYYDVGLHRLPVVFCIDRAGVTGDDGPSHHGLLDLALLTKVPGMTVFAPSCYDDVAEMLRHALDITDGPVAIRWPKTAARVDGSPGHGATGRLLRYGAGRQVCLLGLGKLVGACEDAAERLADRGIDASVWDVRVASPLDDVMLDDAFDHRLVVTAEDGITDGGVGSMVAAALRRRARAGSPAPSVVTCGLPLAYLPHGKADEILAAHRLDGAGLADDALRALAAL